jgi:hypothetical protein
MQMAFISAYAQATAQSNLSREGYVSVSSVGNRESYVSATVDITPGTRSEARAFPQGNGGYVHIGSYPHTGTITALKNSVDEVRALRDSLNALLEILER